MVMIGAEFSVDIMSLQKSARDPRIFGQDFVSCAQRIDRAQAYIALIPDWGCDDVKTGIECLHRAGRRRRFARYAIPVAL